MNNPNDNLDVNQYLERIGYTGPIVNSAYMLARLQEQHVHTVPYENLDIINDIPLSLEIPHLYHKIVNQHRGGYCFELNALFGWLLKELGFSVTHYFGRFWRDETNTPAKRRHHILQVDIGDQKYIADVGVGGAGPRHPLELIEDVEQTQGNETYRLTKTEEYGWMLEEWKKEVWDPVFSFTEEPNLPQDFITTSFWCEYSPESPFNKTARVSIRTAAGRNTVDDDEFRIYKASGVHTFKPNNSQEYAFALQTYFGIHSSPTK